MKKFTVIIFICFGPAALRAQTTLKTDTTANPISKVTITKDPRIDLLAKAELDMNNRAKRFVKGYRLFVLKSSDRAYAMRVRTYLLQTFPGENVFMTWQSPFIKMKFGDFEDKADAEKAKKQIERDGVVTGGVYIVPDTIELKPDKLKDLDK
ncbi:MAG: hypothetical protein R2765_12100 [Ferruginibacter sp.]|nr:hypothetical protein [Bacteroidota bacterium]MBX2920279.1 hypothetical protein [Ferruginibacter sp.]MCB0708944.1 hypothetical protein [Chitinophagaceae bacterium]MCC7377865.1 hypothetical protein [Chitinophagaceae bacterium]